MVTNLSQMEVAAALELAERKRLGLNLFRPQSHQEPIFEQPRPKYLLATGGNRGGKTICLEALTAALALDLNITFNDGSQRPARMPWQKGRPIVIWIICINARHIGDVIYPGLFKAGFFKRWFVTHDPDTKELRTYDQEKDGPRNLKRLPHPPFIPARYIDGDFSWDTKRDGIFKNVKLKDPATGKPLAEIHAFTSGSDCPQGRAVDFILVEEQLERNGFLGELQMRLTDTRGQLAWSSWAADEGDGSDLAVFEEMVIREEEAGSGVGKKVVLTLSGNKTFTKEMVAEALDGVTSEEERMQRDLGIRPSEKLRMYPLFHKNVHSAFAYEDRFSTVLKTRDGIPPADWLRTLILDPGTQHPAILLCAVPPPDFGDYQCIYDEIYEGRADPKQLAKLVKAKTVGQVVYRWICDWRAGRQVTMGSDANTRVVDAYARAFADEGLNCVATGSQFIFGSDNVGGRQLVLQSWMHANKEGIPKLRVVEHRCPHLCDQLSKIKKKTVNKEVVDDRKMSGMPSDLVDAIEYYAASGPRWLPLAPRIEDAPTGYQRYMKRFGNKDKNKPIKIGTHY